MNNAKPAETKTLTDQVCNQLREHIMQGHFKPSAKLRIEELKQRYGVGATPIGEALYRLSAYGFVTAHGQRGFRAAEMSRHELADITELRVVIENLALRQSIERADDDWESRVVGAFHHLTKAESTDKPDLQEWETRNTNFHMALISCCDSPWLMRFYQLLYDQHKRYRNLARLDRKSRGSDVHEEHTQICEAALARDIDEVCRVNEEHIRRTAQVLADRLN